MQERLRCALVRGPDLQCAVELLDSPLRVGDAAVDDPGDVPALVRQIAAGAVGARDLEQRDLRRSDGHVVPRSVDETEDERGAQRRGLARHRFGQAQLALGDEGRRVRLGEAAADEHFLDDSSQPLPAREAAEGRVALGQRERDLFHLEPRDLLDEVDLARDIAGAPGRNPEAAVRALEADLREDGRLLGRCDVESDHRVGAFGPELDHRALGQRSLHVDVTSPARSGELGDQPRRERRRGAGDVRVDALFPAVRAFGSPRCATCGARRSAGSRRARSSRPRAEPTSCARRLRSPRLP